jgi:hypothetical protein
VSGNQEGGTTHQEVVNIGHSPLMNLQVTLSSSRGIFSYLEKAAHVFRMKSYLSFP